jgi:hypothetical protein
MALTNATTLADYGSGIGTQGATLKVDANNQRVGIGTLTPAETLDVVGNMAVEGDISVTGTISYDDVTNVDAIGLSTFRNGLHVTGGLVGIGTDNPGVAGIDILANSAAIRCRESGGADARLVSGGSLSYFGTYSNHDLQILTNGSNALRITSAGLVGINSASPISRLDINAGSVTGLSAGTITNVLSITESGSQSGTGQRILFKNVQQNWEQGAITALREGGADSFSLTLSSSNGGTNAEALRITSSGNVGIGSTNPSDKLVIYNSNVGNPTGLTIRNTEASSAYSHARLRLESQNAAAYGEIWADVANAGLRLGYNSSNTVKINSSGNIVFNSGSGIDFSATSDTGGMTSELLDDYEEGTWTPQLDFNGGTTGITYAALNGAYIKIGRMVMVRGGFALTNKGSSSGSAYVGGLPFTVESLSYADATAIGGAAALSSINGPPVVVAQNAQTKALLWYNTTSGTRVLITQANFNNNTELYFSLVYTVS